MTGAASRLHHLAPSRVSSAGCTERCWPPLDVGDAALSASISRRAAAVELPSSQTVGTRTLTGTVSSAKSDRKWSSRAGSWPLVCAWQTCEQGAHQQILRRAFQKVSGGSRTCDAMAPGKRASTRRLASLSSFFARRVCSHVTAGWVGGAGAAVLLLAGAPDAGRQPSSIRTGHHVEPYASNLPCRSPSKASPSTSSCIAKSGICEELSFPM